MWVKAKAPTEFKRGDQCKWRHLIGKVHNVTVQRKWGDQPASSNLMVRIALDRGLPPEHANLLILSSYSFNGVYKWST